MNIGLIVHDLHEHGGHSLYTRTLADELALRHDVTVFANSCERPADAEWKSVAVGAWRQSALATVHTFPLGMRAQAGRLAGFDIRHAQGFCGGRPNVVTAHICLAGYLNSLRDVSPRTRLSLRLMCAAEKRFYRGYDGHVIAVSQKVADELREFYGFRGPVTVIHHGVNSESFNREWRAFDRLVIRQQLGIGADATVALYVGDLTKSHTHLKAIANAMPDVQFVIVTRSSQYHWRQENVRILPGTSDPGRFFAAADAFVFPTTYDAFGMVVLEAMAAGLPVFTSDRAGAAEIITSDQDGFVSPLDNWVEATAAKLRNQLLLRTTGSEARKTARQHDWSKVVRKVEELYFAVAEVRQTASVLSGEERAGWQPAVPA